MCTSGQIVFSLSLNLNSHGLTLSLTLNFTPFQVASPKISASHRCSKHSPLPVEALTHSQSHRCPKLSPPICSLLLFKFFLIFFFNMSLWEYEMFFSIFLFGIFYLNYGLQQMGCATSSYRSLKTWNFETLWCNCNILWNKLCILCFVFVVNVVPKRRWEKKMNLGFIQKKKKIGWATIGAMG